MRVWERPAEQDAGTRSLSVLEGSRPQAVTVNPAGGEATRGLLSCVNGALSWLAPGGRGIFS